MTSYSEGYALFQCSQEFPFRFYEATNYFTAKGIFSEVNIPVDSIKDSAGSSFAVHLSRLINFYPEQLCYPKKRPPHLADLFEKLVYVLKRCRHINLNKNFGGNNIITEKEVIGIIAREILKPLFGKITFEKGYGKALSKVGLDCDLII